MFLKYDKKNNIAELTAEPEDMVALLRWAQNGIREHMIECQAPTTDQLRHTLGKFSLYGELYMECVQAEVQYKIDNTAPPP